MQAQDRPQPQPGKSPEVNINKPQIFILANGLKVMVVEDHKLPRVSYTLTLDNAPFVEGSKKGVDNLTSAMLGSGSKKIAKDDFNEEIDFYGASINFSSKGASASCLTRYAFRVLELLADGALHPNFTEIEFEKEKTKMLEGLKTQEKSVSAISSRISNVLALSLIHI
jgi:zinc protease